MYSRNHCFTSIPNDAVMRLNTRDANQRTLSVTVEGETVGAAASSAGEVVNAGWVEFTKGWFTEKLESCKDICCKMAAV